MPDGNGWSRSWRVHRLGTPEEALSLDEVPHRAPGPGEARVAISAIGLNFPDLLLCSGRYQQRPELPFSPGFEASGTVAETGPGSAVRQGQRVLVVPEFPAGAMQESLTVADEQLYPVPDAMPLSAAAVLHIAYQTAHLAIHHRARLSAGETLLVNGAAGGVGSAAVQLGRAAGGKVIATVTGRDKAAFCQRAGADQVIDLAEGDGDLLARLRAATGEHGADVIVDVVGGEQFEALRRCVAFGGRIVVVGFTGGSIATAPTNHVLLRNYSIIGLHMAAYRTHDPALLRAVHQQLLKLYLDGAISPETYRELPLEQAKAGLALLGRREAIGRVVLRC